MAYITKKPRAVFIRPRISNNGINRTQILFISVLPARALFPGSTCDPMELEVHVACCSIINNIILLCSRQNNPPPPAAHIQTPGTSEYIMPHGKAEISIRLN